jgi:acetoin utilization deacetylase AcuC-like enzyme
MMKKTGIFFHEVMRNEHAPLDMNIGKGFDAIREEGLFEEEGVGFFEANRVTEDLVLVVHTKEWVAEVKRGGYWEVSLLSAGAVAMALEKVLSGELHNALSLVGAGVDTMPTGIMPGEVATSITRPSP